MSVPAPDTAAVRQALAEHSSLGQAIGYRPLARTGPHDELVCTGWLINCERGSIQFDRDMHTVAAWVWKPMPPAVWTFESTGDAYDACQVRDDIEDGDVLVIERERVIGIAYTWPFALTEEYGELHTLNDHLDPRTYQDGKYAPTVSMAEREAARLGIPLTRANKDATATAAADKKED